MAPRFGVLLAAYNGAAWIDEQVNSILAQVGVEVEIFISVDKSFDGTETIVKNYAATCDRVHAMEFGHTFGGAAGNFFHLISNVDIDSFDYWALADQDDIWNEEKLSAAVAKISSGTADAYSSNALAFWPDGRTRFINKSQPQTCFDHLFEAAGPGCTYVFTNSLFQAIQRSVEQHADEIKKVALHDWYCYAFSRERGYRWIIDSNTYIRYRQHAANQVGINHGLRAARARLSKIRAGWYTDQAKLIAGLVGCGNTAAEKALKRDTAASYMFLAFNAARCRRRLRDKAVFFGICIVTAMKKAGYGFRK